MKSGRTEVTRFEEPKGRKILKEGTKRSIVIAMSRVKDDLGVGIARWLSTGRQRPRGYARFGWD